MKKGLQFFLLFGFVTLYIALSLPTNVINASEKEDTIEAKADSYVTETEKIFEETEDNPKERRSRLSDFTTKAKEILSAPFSKTLTKITLIQMEVVCSRMPDLESAGFSTFPQSYILLEVLGKNNVDSSQLIKTLSNKRNDWKFRWLIADILFDLRISNEEVTNTMMGIILDKSENMALRHRCLFLLSAKGTSIYKGKPIGKYLMRVYKEEKELKVEAQIKLGMMKYKPALDMLIQDAKQDTVDPPIAGLGYMRDKKALPVLFKLLKKVGKHKRVYICEALGKIGGDEAIDTLINILENDKDDFVRYCTANALAETDCDKAYRVLIKHGCVMALGEAARHGQLKALDALKEVGTPFALQRLEWFSTEEGSSSAKVRERAKGLLKEAEGEK